MIIDFHTHLAYHEIYPAAFIETMFKGEGPPDTVQRLAALARRWLEDAGGERLLKEMDGAGVSRSVLLMVDAGLRFGEAARSLEQSYELHRRVRESAPDRFLVFGAVDPRRGRAGLEQFRQSVVAWGFSGMKLYPPMGFSLTDSRLEPYLDLCSERGLPVLTHFGHTYGETVADSGDPFDLGGLARRRPDLTFVMAHGGHRLADPDVRRVLDAGNVLVDVSAFQAEVRASGWEQTSRSLRLIFEDDFNERVLFGSDYPLFHLAAGVRDDVARIRSAFEESGSGDVTKLENVLWRNAERVLTERGSARVGA